MIASIVRGAAMAVGAAVLLAMASAQAPVAFWIWKKFQTYPEIETVRADVRSSPLPWRSLAELVVDAAQAEHERAELEFEREPRARGFRAAQRRVFAAYLVLQGPVFLGWSVLVGIAVAVLRGRGTEPIDLDRQVIAFDLAHVARVGLEIDERPLPEWGNAPVGLEQARGWSGEDLEVFEVIRRAALAGGVESAMREVERLPGAKAEVFRAALVERKGIIDALRAYRSSWEERTAQRLQEKALTGVPQEDRAVFAKLWAAALESEDALRAELGALPARRVDELQELLEERSASVEWLRKHRARMATAAATGPVVALPPPFQALLQEGVPPDLLELREELREMGELTPLRVRQLAQLAAHPRHPASIEHHGAHEGGLIIHTVAVVRKGLEMIRAGEVSVSERKALITALLHHDIGKAHSFREKEKEEGFEAIDRLHAQNGALVLGVMPELWKEHGAEGEGLVADATRILLVVGHEHDPESIPLSLTKLCEPLMAAVREADGTVTALEGGVDEKLRDVAVEQALAVFPRILREMNINGGKLSPKADGIFDQEAGILLIMEAKFRDELTAGLGDWGRPLGLSYHRPRDGRAHPGWLAVARGLQEEGALRDFVTFEGKRVPTDDNHLMTVAFGKVVFRGVFPVDLKWLQAKLGRDTFESLTFNWELARSWPIVGIRTGTDTQAAKELHELIKKKYAKGQGDGDADGNRKAGRGSKEETRA